MRVRWFFRWWQFWSSIGRQKTEVIAVTLLLSSAMPVANANVVFSGNTCSAPGTAIVGCFGSGSGTLNVTPSSDLVVGLLQVGSGTPATTTGNVNISGVGARIDVSSSLAVGDTATGLVNVSGGGILNASDTGTAIGLQVGSQGVVNISGIGSQLILLHSASVGVSGVGSLNVTSGGTINGSGLVVGVGSVNNKVVVDGANSGLNLVGTGAGVSLGAGNGAQGSLTVSNGGHVTINSTGTGTAAGFTVGGQTSTGAGSMVVSGAGSQVLISGDSTSTLFPGFTVGRGGFGDLQVLGGGKVTVTNDNAGTGGFNVGGIGGSIGSGFPVGTGTIEISGVGSSLDVQAIHGNFDIGSRSGGVGTVTVSSGGLIHAEQGTLGLTTGSTGTLTISGSGSSVLLNGNDGAGSGAVLRVGGSGQGTLNVMNGAQLTVTSTSDVGGLVAGGNGTQTGGIGTINVSGGSILINGGTSSRLSLGGGTGGSASLTITNGGQVFVAPTPGSGGGVYISRVAGATGSASVSGSSSLLSAGSFLGIGIATNQVSNSGIGTLTLQAGGTVSATNIRIGVQGSVLGIGNLVGNVTDSGGIVSPGLGNSFGQIGINGNFGMGFFTGLGGLISLDVGGTTSQNHDSLRVSGSADLSGGAISINQTNGYRPKVGDVIQLISAAGGVTGSNPLVTFAQPQSLPYNYSSGFITFLAPPPPPAPTSLFSSQTKSDFQAESQYASYASTGLSLVGAVKDLADPLNVVPQLLDAEGLTLSSVSMLHILDDQVSQALLGSASLLLDGVGVAISCAGALAAVGVPIINALSDVGCAIASLQAAADITSDIAGVLAKDPPDASYQTVFIPQIPVAPEPLTNACANAMTAAKLAPYGMDQANSWLLALAITADRYSTALANNDSLSAGLQSAAFSQYLSGYQAQAQLVSTNLKCLENFLAQGGVGDLSSAYSGALGSIGTTSLPFLNTFYKGLGLSDSDIQAILAGTISDPPPSPDHDLLISLEALSAGLPANSTVSEPSGGLLMLSGVVFLFVFSRLVKSR